MDTIKELREEIKFLKLIISYLQNGYRLTEVDWEKGTAGFISGMIIDDDNYYKKS